MVPRLPDRRGLAEIVREQKRMVDKAIRGLERERQGMERQEKKLIMEMKTMAKKGQDVCMHFQ